MALKIDPDYDYLFRLRQMGVVADIGTTLTHPFGDDGRLPSELDEFYKLTPKKLDVILRDWKIGRPWAQWVLRGDATVPRPSMKISMAARMSAVMQVMTAARIFDHFHPSSFANLLVSTEDDTRLLCDVAFSRNMRRLQGDWLKFLRTQLGMSGPDDYVTRWRQKSIYWGKRK